jgi:hypothetical protein
VVYQRLTAYPRGLGQLAPRRFAAGLAGTLALGIAVLLLAGSTIAAWAIELFFAVAVVAVAFTDFCPGAALYHRLVALKRTA